MSYPTPPPMDVVPLPDVPYRPPVAVMRGRPGVISAMGIVGIIVAAICMIGGGLTASINFLYASASKQQPPAVTPKPPVVALVEYVPREGLGLADRQPVIGALGMLQPLSSKAAGQLDEMLAENGQKLFGSLGGTASAEGVKNLVTASGHMDQADGDMAYFVLGDGRLQISDGMAVYRPADGSPAITTHAFDVPQKMPGSAPAVLTDDQIRSVLRATTEQHGGRLKASETKAMIDLLTLPGQQFVLPTTDGTDPAFEVTSVADNEYTGLSVTAVHNGQDAVATVPAGSSVASVQVNKSVGPMPMFHLYRPAALSLGLFSAMNLAVAAFLLTASILTLRQSRHSGWMLRTFVPLKLVASAGVIVAGRSMWTHLANDLRPYNPQIADSISTFGTTMGVFPAIGCIFPVVLAVLLVLPAARRYFKESRLVVG